MINIGIIGYGYWGPNLVRNFAETPGARVAAVADLDKAKLETVQRRYPTVKTTTNFQELLQDPSIDAIAVATPVSTHFEFGMAALKAGKHLWVEKPPPLTDGAVGLDVIRALAAAQRSLEQSGAFVTI